MTPKVFKCKGKYLGCSNMYAEGEAFRGLALFCGRAQWSELFIVFVKQFML